MNWSLLVLISITSISIANIFQRVLMKGNDSDPVVSAVIFQFGITAFTAVFAAIKGFTPPPIIEYWFFFLTSAVLYGLGTVFYFRAAKKAEASQIVVLSALGTVVSIVASMVFFGRIIFLEANGGDGFDYFGNICRSEKDFIGQQQWSA